MIESLRSGTHSSKSPFVVKLCTHFSIEVSDDLRAFDWRRFTDKFNSFVFSTSLMRISYIDFSRCSIVFREFFDVLIIGRFDMKVSSKFIFESKSDLF